MSKQRRTWTPMAVINVTSLVDVMMVLLVVFMVTSPLMTSGLDVDLPKSSAARTRDEQGIIITLTRTGDCQIGDQKIRYEYLGAKLQELKAKGRLSNVSLKGDKNLPYGTVMEVISLLKDNEVTALGLITENPTEKKAKVKSEK